MISSNEKILHKIHSNNGFQHQLPSCLAGEVYRLRQPSYKYLTSVTKYDSSNPTKDWDFPCLNLDFLKDVNSEGLDSALKPSHDTVIAKPFSPNLNHRRFELLKRKVAIECWNFCMLSLQQIESELMKGLQEKAHLIPSAVRVLTKKEIASVEEVVNFYLVMTYTCI